MSDYSELRRAYSEINKQYRVFESKVGATIALIGVPAGTILDLLVYPEHVVQFFYLRLAASALIGICLLLHYTALGRKHIQILTFTWLSIVQVAICFMIYRTDGFSSTYYAGLNLPIVALGILLPTSVLETAVFCLATTVFYSLASTASASIPQDSSVVFNNLFFLILTSVIGTIAVHFNLKRRFSEFSLRFELDKNIKKLAELDRQKTDFFSNISHELRTPLTLILAPVQELLETGGRMPDAVASRLGVVRNNALRLLKLVNDLLDMMRLEEGKEMLEHLPVDLNSIVHGMVDSMIHLAESKGIVLEKRLCSERLVVDGDGRALEKIMVNLINNAIKFTGNGGTIRIECGKEYNRAVLCVIDSGIGIPVEEQSYIFNRFHQVDGSATRRYRGTGLGLALVKEMTERMGGEVKVDSKVGEGTTMRVMLPLSVYQGGDRDEEMHPDEDALERLHHLADQRGGLTVEEMDKGSGSIGVADSDNRPIVLVVEDEPDMRHYLVDILEGDYRVLEARTGKAGLQLACEYRPSLVMLDWMLPEMDGLEICKRIKEDEACKDQKVMLLTARVDEKSKLMALKHGADDFLTKPFSSIEVKTRLHNLLATAMLERNLRIQNENLQEALNKLEVTQGQLIHSEKLNALGSLAAGLLHEINNPLNYSLTALQLVRGDAAIRDNELVQEVIADIDEGMQRVRAIVSDLRAFAYPSEMEKRLPFDVREALESAERFTAHELKEITVVSHLPDDVLVLGSKSHITQVFVNLLTNSAKAIQGRGREYRGEIVVSGSIRDSRLSMTVADNGVGMDKEILERIFDPFFTTRDVGEGMGLGLSISHTIIANHGGRLQARSKPGEGTELVFDLPLAGNEPIEAGEVGVDKRERILDAGGGKPSEE